MVTEPAGLLWTWWQGDLIPVLSPLQTFRVTVTMRDSILGRLSSLSTAEIQARVATSHRPYVAWIGSRPVAYGWSAAGETRFGSPPVAFTVPPGNRYLLDFMTLPRWRGYGIYPRLLQAIVSTETADVARFWILHHCDNAASARGIAKAGFSAVAEIHVLAQGGLALVAAAPGERVRAGANVLGLPIVRANGKDHWI